MSRKASRVKQELPPAPKERSQSPSLVHSLPDAPQEQQQQQQQQQPQPQPHRHHGHLMNNDIDEQQQRPPTISPPSMPSVPLASSSSSTSSSLPLTSTATGQTSNGHGVSSNAQFTSPSSGGGGHQQQRRQEHLQYQHQLQEQRQLEQQQQQQQQQLHSPQRQLRRTGSSQSGPSGVPSSTGGGNQPQQPILPPPPPPRTLQVPAALRRQESSFVGFSDIPSLPEFLGNHNLSQYLKSFIEAGAGDNDIPQMLDFEEDDLRELIEAVPMKKMHAITFKKGIRDLRERTRAGGTQLASGSMFFESSAHDGSMMATSSSTVGAGHHSHHHGNGGSMMMTSTSHNTGSFIQMEPPSMLQYSTSQVFASSQTPSQQQQQHLLQLSQGRSLSQQQASQQQREQREHEQREREREREREHEYHDQQHGYRQEQHVSRHPQRQSNQNRARDHPSSSGDYSDSHGYSTRRPNHAGEKRSMGSMNSQDGSFNTTRTKRRRSMSSSPTLPPVKNPIQRSNRDLIRDYENDHDDDLDQDDDGRGASPVLDSPSPPAMSSSPIIGDDGSHINSAGAHSGGGGHRSGSSSSGNNGSVGAVWVNEGSSGSSGGPATLGAIGTTTNNVLTPETIYHQATVYGKHSSRALTSYEESINKAARELAHESPALLASKGDLLRLAKAKLLKEGYTYKRGKSRSKLPEAATMAVTRDHRVTKEQLIQKREANANNTAKARMKKITDLGEELKRKNHEREQLLARLLELESPNPDVVATASTTISAGAVAKAMMVDNQTLIQEARARLGTVEQDRIRMSKDLGSLKNKERKHQWYEKRKKIKGEGEQGGEEDEEGGGGDGSESVGPEGESEKSVGPESEGGSKATGNSNTASNPQYGMASNAAAASSSAH